MDGISLTHGSNPRIQENTSGLFVGSLDEIGTSADSCPWTKRAVSHFLQHLWGTVTSVIRTANQEKSSSMVKILWSWLWASEHML